MTDGAEYSPTVQLTYTIAGGSEHSGRYVAQNILVDNPADQASRWSGASQANNNDQYILLRLESLAVLKSITFGKFHRPHPCNMKEFKLYVGLTEDNMTEVVHSGLKNDAEPETFYITSVNQQGLTYPSRFVKIEPLSAHGQSFHVSIWYVALHGISDAHFVSAITNKHEEFQERVILRHIMKHLRQRKFMGPYQSILEQSGVQLEHPLVTALHHALVIQGDFAASEASLDSFASASLFSASLQAEQPHASWSQLHAVDADGDAPSPRGGHAMCMDTLHGKIYMFGGWDGQKNLDDFWVYDVRSGKWQVLNYATQREPHGPGPRSCHKMIFDTTTGCVYVFGRLDDANLGDIGEIPVSSGATHGSGTEPPLASPTSPRQTSPPVSLSSARTTAWPNRGAEFHRYHTRGRDAGKWELLSSDTAAAGGPPLVFDHQMVIDSEAQVIYISGGRVVDGDWDSLKFSGLYSYDIKYNKWKMIQSSDASTTYPSIPSRFGHSMVLDPKLQVLFIFGGQREERYLSDMYAYHIPTNTVTELYASFTSAGGPDACFTQRAVIDPSLREIYLFCGLTRSKALTETVLESDSPYWIYRYGRADRPGKWSKILPSDEPDAIAPVPRYAHQVVYDATSRTVYIHGGNSCLEQAEEGRSRSSSGRAVSEPRHASGASEERIEHVELGHTDRLDDFWKMSLARPSPAELIRRGKYLIRQQRFRELCEDSTPIKALSYLQTDVSAVVNHASAEEALVFRSLLSHLLSPSQPAVPDDPLTKKRSRDEYSPLDASKDFSEDEPMHDASSSEPSVGMQDDAPETSAASGSGVSPERHKQRSDVFEQLMAFVNPDAKQPEKDLIRLINVDSGGVF